MSNHNQSLAEATASLDPNLKELFETQTVALLDLEKAIIEGKKASDLTPFLIRLQQNHLTLAEALATQPHPEQEAPKQAEESDSSPQN